MFSKEIKRKVIIGVCACFRNQSAGAVLVELMKGIMGRNPAYHYSGMIA